MAIGSSHMASLASSMALPYSLRLARDVPRPTNAACGPGVEFDRLVEVGDGLVVILFELPNLAATAVMRRTPGIEPDGFVVVAEGGFILLSVSPESARAAALETVFRMGVDLPGEKLDSVSGQDELVAFGPTARAMRFRFKQHRGAVNLLNSIKVDFLTATIECFAVDEQGELACPRHNPLADPARILLCRERQVDRADKDSDRPKDP